MDDLFLPNSHYPKGKELAADGTAVGGAYNANALYSRAPNQIDSSTSSSSSSYMAHPPQPFEFPRRTTTFSRQPEELHIPSANVLTSNMPELLASQNYLTHLDGAAVHLPSINVQSSSADPSAYGSSANTNSALPGALQPGHAGRPTAISSNTAPSMIPTLPQLSPQAQQQQPPSTPRSAPTNSHGHSQSSPAGFEHHRYIQQGTEETLKYPPSPAAGYPPQTPRGSKYSPLGLADIRPADEPMMDTAFSPSGLQYNNEPQVPTNSNHLAPWPVYAVDWCKWPIGGYGNSGGKIALGSYLEDNYNYIQIIDTQLTSPDPDTPDAAAGEVKLEFVKTAEATHSYPVTRILWEPPSPKKHSTDLLATSGDHLRLWSLPTGPVSQSSNSITRNQREAPIAKLAPLALLSNSKSPEHTAPITSLDWNTISPSLIITSSIDTTCTIWDIPTLTAKTQLIAHDKEVYDVRFCANSVDVFVSCGADGSVRMFDLRSLEHSTIIYEPSEKNEKITSPGGSSPSTPHQSALWPPPLLRIAASPHDSHLLATFSQDSNIVRVLDVRQPGQALLELKGHSASINCVEWSAHRRGILASGADDCMVLLWDLINPQNSASVSSTANVHNSAAQSSASERGPAAVWQCDYEVSNISWSPQYSTNHSHPRQWLGVCGGRGFWGVAQ